MSVEEFTQIADCTEPTRCIGFRTVGAPASLHFTAPERESNDVIHVFPYYHATNGHISNT